MAWCARKTSVRDANILLTGEVPGNNVMSTIKKVSKKMNNLRKQTNKQKQKQNKKKREVILTFYVMKWKWQTYSTSD